MIVKDVGLIGERRGLYWREGQMRERCKIKKNGREIEVCLPE